MEQARIRSHGDLEVLILHEAHEMLADIIGPNLYKILGEAPDQQVQFGNEQLFNLFLIRLVELFVEARNIGHIGEKRKPCK